MKRSQRWFSLLLIAVLALAFAGCGSAKSDASYASPAAVAGGYSTSAAFDSGDYAMAEEAYAPAAPMEAARQTSGLGSKNAVSSDSRPMSEKVIYNGHVNLETTKFDEATERIAALIDQYEGFLENSSISGSNFSSISRGKPGARSASYTIRVPSVNFSAIMSSLPEIGNVPYSETSTRNVTREYYDVQSRLDAYRTQEARLLEMLSVAETVEDMLSIQRELTEVQYELDSLTGTLRYYDDQVSYSTIYLSVQEVREYTPEPTITLTYKERMVKGFQESVESTVNFFKEFFLWLVTSLPWLIPLIVFAILVIALLKKLFSRDPERRARRAERRAAKKAKKQAKAAARAQRRLDKKAAKKAEAAPEAAAPPAPVQEPEPDTNDSKQE